MLLLPVCRLPVFPARLLVGALCVEHIDITRIVVHVLQTAHTQRQAVEHVGKVAAKTEVENQLQLSKFTQRTRNNSVPVF